MDQAQAQAASEYVSSGVAKLAEPQPALREAEGELNAMIEAVEILTERLVAKIDPVLLPAPPMPGTLDSNPEREGCDLTRTFRNWQRRLSNVRDILDGTYHRVDL